MFERQKQAIKTIDFDNAMMMAMSNYTEDIADMNRAQLWAGKDSAAVKMSPSYAKSTKKVKARKGQPTGRVTLKDKGTFHGSIKAVAEQKAMVVGSKHTVKGFELSKFLDEKYGGLIYGLTPANLEKIIKRLMPEFYRYVLDDFL